MTERLQLTWPDKERFLLTPRDSNGRPVWVDRRHPGAVEIRRHRFLGSAGLVTDSPYEDNLLIHGDSLDALKILTEVPEFRRHYRGKVKLIYMDPPFNTGQTFETYDDWLDHSTWLSLMRERLMVASNLLARDGSIWLHLDDAEQHRARVLLDEIFGASNFVTSVFWLRKDTRANDARLFSPNTDVIHVYARNIESWSLNRLPRTAKMDAEYANPDNDPRGPWLAAPLYAKSGSAAEFAYTFRSGPTWSPPRGTFARFSAERLGQLEDDGRIYFGKDGSAQPSLKQFLAEMRDGVVPTNNWHYEEVGSNRHSRLEQKRLFDGVAPFPTAKPERLLERILHLASDPGDIVLDCFAGSGTTPAVATKMGRRWIAVEREPATVATFIRPRLEQVVDGRDLGGISQHLNWSGGGGFREVGILPPLYEVMDGGIVALTADPADPQVAVAVAGQLGFELTSDRPFVGRRGRMRLAVLPEAVGPEEVVELAGNLAENECLTLVAPAILPDTEATLRRVSPGSRVLKLPRDVLAAKTHRRQGERG